MDYVLPAVGAIVGLCWLSALLHWLMLFGHRKPDVSAARLFTSGISAFDADHFTASGKPVHRRFVRSVAAFFFGVVALALLGAIASGSAPPSSLPSAAPSVAPPSSAPSAAPSVAPPT